METLLQAIEKELQDIDFAFKKEYSSEERRQLDKYYSREMHFAHDQGAMWALNLIRDLVKENA